MGPSKAIDGYGCPACLVTNFDVAPHPVQVRAAMDAANGDPFTSCAPYGAMQAAGNITVQTFDAGGTPPVSSAF